MQRGVVNKLKRWEQNLSKTNKDSRNMGLALTLSFRNGLVLIRVFKVLDASLTRTSKHGIRKWEGELKQYLLLSFSLVRLNLTRR